MIRVFLVDDSPLVLQILQRMLSHSSDIRVVGTAGNGREALAMLPDLDPDVICTDLYMPVMDGLEFTHEVMERHPRPILVVSVSVEPGSPNVFQLLEAGAVDVYAKPRAILNADMERLAKGLIGKIRVLAGVRVIRRHGGPRQASASPPPGLRPHAAARIVAIGASTGGPQALREILSHLPDDFPLPVVCIQHIGATFLSQLLDWLGEACPLPVRKAALGETAQAGVVHFAPEDHHLEFDETGRFTPARTPPVDGHRPSVTVTLRAVARCYGATAVGVLLTGMGRDGAEGMAAIAAAGGVTIAQDEASSVVWGMPAEAVKLGAARHVLPLEQIAPALAGLAQRDATGGSAQRERKTK